MILNRKKVFEEKAPIFMENLPTSKLNTSLCASQVLSRACWSIRNIQIITSSLQRLNELSVLTRTIVKIFQGFTNNLIAPFIILSANKTKYALQGSAGSGPVFQYWCDLSEFGEIGRKSTPVFFKKITHWHKVALLDQFVFLRHLNIVFFENLRKLLKTTIWKMRFQSAKK